VRHPVTVALPIRNGGDLLGEVLAAVASQRVDRDVELLVCDSGSTDGSAERARAAGARMLTIMPERFSHGGTRNLLMKEARGTHVALLTQDATPADDRWLQRLLDGFEVADDVGLVTGPYVARPGASVMVRREYRDFFGAMHDGGPRAVRIADAGDPPAPGPSTYHSDANGAILRAAWERVPFRAVPYAEDQLLCIDMLRAGYAKVFQPGAAVLHSHAYAAPERFRRHFDEFRALREVYGHVADAHPRRLAGRLRGEIGRDRAFARDEGVGGLALQRVAAASLGYHGPRLLAAALGSRASALPGPVRRVLSLERRASFLPVGPR
jgi:GT2 family glycosyltransferase